MKRLTLLLCLCFPSALIGQTADQILDQSGITIQTATTAGKELKIELDRIKAKYAAEVEALRKEYLQKASEPVKRFQASIELAKQDAIKRDELELAANLKNLSETMEKADCLGSRIGEILKGEWVGHWQTGGNSKSLNISS